MIGWEDGEAAALGRIRLRGATAPCAGALCAHALCRAGCGVRAGPCRRSTSTTPTSPRVSLTCSVGGRASLRAGAGKPDDGEGQDRHQGREHAAHRDLHVQRGAAHGLRRRLPLGVTVHQVRWRRCHSQTSPTLRASWSRCAGARDAVRSGATHVLTALTMILDAVRGMATAWHQLRCTPDCWTGVMLGVGWRVGIAEAPESHAARGIKQAPSARISLHQ